MKNYKSLLFVLTLFISTILSAQITIGTGMLTNESAPINPYYGYSYTQVIYLAAEIGTSGNITALTYYATPTTVIGNSNDWTVYIGQTTQTTFDLLDWIPLANLTQSFTGSVTLVGGQVKVVLDTPFAYNGTDNLVIAVDENKVGFDNITDDFYSSSVATKRTVAITDDNFNADPVNAIGMGFTENSIANITLDFSTTGVDEKSKNNSLVSIYPNPNNGLFTIKNLLKEKITVQIMNVQGKLIYRTTSDSSTLNVDLSENAKGIYFVTIVSNNENETYKILVH